MEKSLDIALKHQMNVDEMPNLGDIPLLGQRAKQLIAARKKDAVGSGQSQSTMNFLDILFSKYKMVSLSFCLIGIISAINFLMTFDIETGAGKTSNVQADTSLTVSSNTYLATLNQPTITEVPAKTNTALTSIATFKN
ncbi:MAG: hypothetical protein SGJ15_03430 [Bacteroidota bacterium]|nr:hypothetical protein [Bacteroidota bacterium]